MRPGSHWVHSVSLDLFRYSLVVVGVIRWRWVYLVVPSGSSASLVVVGFIRVHPGGGRQMRPEGDWGSFGGRWFVGFIVGSLWVVGCFLEFVRFIRGCWVHSGSP